MDSLITAAGRALRAGDPLGALKRVALRNDPPALALRGIAMAQLGDLPRARELLRRAGRRFGPRETLARARCLTAEAEVALAAREFGSSVPDLTDAVRTFATRGDEENALHARLLQVRRLLLLGRVDEADAACAKLGLAGAPDRLAAITSLVVYEIALRRGRASDAQQALDKAREAARRSGIEALVAEVEQAGQALVLPAARLVIGRESRSLTLSEVERVLSSEDLVIDACRRVARRGPRSIRLAQRPALFSLLLTLAERWPAEAPREVLIARAFDVRRPNASHRARLRVAMGRLRQELRPIAEVHATARGFALAPRDARTVLVVAPPIETPHAALLALLADGEAWSTSALGQALGASQRTVQRALTALQEAGQVRSVGGGRSRRWLAAPVTRFATPLLLPVWDGPG